MAISTVSITQGSGTNITVDSSAGGDMQVIKLAESALGSTSLVPASASTGLLVNLGTCSAASLPVTNVPSQNLNVAVQGTATVSGAVSISNTPAVTQSGTWNIGTVTTITNTVTVAGSVSISGTPAVSQSGTWNIGTVASITGTVTVTGTVGISGTPTIQGTVTANQGSPASAANAWPVKITDTTNTLTMQSVSGVYALPVKVLAQAGGGYSQQDMTAFTLGTTSTEVIGGVYNSSYSALGAGQAGACGVTQYRALYVNLQKSSGAEIGTQANPLVINSASTQANAMPIIPCAPDWPYAGATGRTYNFWRQHVAYTASQTAIAIHTPGSGKTPAIMGIDITPTAAGTVTIFDNSDSSTTELYNGTPPVNGGKTIVFATPVPLAAANDVLRYTTGSGATGDITVWGVEI